VAAWARGRVMTIYGYARLVGYDEKLNMQADILERFDVADDRVFTFKIREGHKWSDGSLLTPEDFRYCWEDVWLNDELSPDGLAPTLLADGKPPRFEIVDPTMWDKPWGGEYPWNATNEQIYEYACHEGNYGMLDVLRGARFREKEGAGKR
jgi:peptide/nickel transport system substrate-binding protein